MSRLRVAAARAPLRGSVTVAGDKSIGHRAVMLAAIATGRSTISGLSGGEDNHRTVEALRALGVTFTEMPGGVLSVEGVGLGGLRAPSGALYCGNSGTTMRLLCGLLAAQRFAVRLDGDRSLRRRPMERVVEPLRRMGARIRGEDGGPTYGPPYDPTNERDREGPEAGQCAERDTVTQAPLLVGPAAGPLRGIEHRSAVASAQVKSAVILAALSAHGATRLVEPERSRDHTERMLRAMGAPLTACDEPDGAVVVVDPGSGWSGALSPRAFVVPGDLSSAAFLIGAALVVPGSDIVVRAVGVNPTRTGLLDALIAMGADVTTLDVRDAAGEPIADLRVRHGQLRGVRVNGSLTVRAIDEIPLLAALAAHAEGETVIRGAAELRVKESDRIAAMVGALRGFGSEVDELDDGMVIRGGAPLRPARVDSHGDHRIAMAAAVCALGASSDGDRVTWIDDTDNVATSFPGFAAVLASLGAPIGEHQ